MRLDDRRTDARLSALYRLLPHDVRRLRLGVQLEKHRVDLLRPRVLQLHRVEEIVDLVHLVEHRWRDAQRVLEALAGREGVAELADQRHLRRKVDVDGTGMLLARTRLGEGEKVEVEPASTLILEPPPSKDNTPESDMSWHHINS